MNKIIKKFMWKHFFDYMFEKEYKNIFSGNRVVKK